MLVESQCSCAYDEELARESASDAAASTGLTGRVVTGDAMFCQRDVCDQILHQGGHYFFALKDNQPTLKEAVAAEFQAAFSPDERTPTRCAS